MDFRIACAVLRADCLPGTSRDLQAPGATGPVRQAVVTRAGFLQEQLFDGRFAHFLFVAPAAAAVDSV